MSKLSKSESLSIFRILDLPLEVRQLIYSFALPYQDTPLREDTTWAEIKNTPNTSMNLLCSNLQISNEARKILYGDNAFTITLNSIGGISVQVSKERIHSCGPFPTTPSLKYIKHWQLDLKFYPEYSALVYQSPSEGMAKFQGHPSVLSFNRLYCREALRSVADEIINCQELASLKVKMPCICHKESPLNEVIPIVQSALEPLGRLQFSGKVTYIAIPTISELNGGLRREVTVPPSRIQCSKQACLDFSELLSHYLSRLVSPSSPLIQLTSSEIECLKLYKKACMAMSDRAVLDSINEVRSALEGGTAEQLNNLLAKANAAVDSSEQRKMDTKLKWAARMRGYGHNETDIMRVLNQRNQSTQAFWNNYHLPP